MANLPPKRRRFTPKQRAALMYAAQHHENPEVRKQCQALIRVDEGQSLEIVAEAFNMKSTKTIKRWLERFLNKGVEGLGSMPGRPLEIPGDPIDSQIGSSMRSARNKAGLSQEDVVDRVNYIGGQQGLSDMETGKRMLSLRNFTILCDLYSIDAQEQERIKDVFRRGESDLPNQAST